MYSIDRLESLFHNDSFFFHLMKCQFVLCALTHTKCVCMYVYMYIRRRSALAPYLMEIPSSIDRERDR